MRAWRSGARAATARALVLGLVVSVLVTAASRVGALTGWQTRAVDLFVFLRDRVPTPDIVLVLIDEDAFAEMGGRQPLSRGYLATLAEFLLASGAHVVALDVQFPTPTDPDEDAALLAVSRRWAAGPGGRLAFATTATGDVAARRFSVAAPFSSALRGLFGYANAPRGADGVIRHMRPVLPAVAGGYLPSLALATLAASDRRSPEVLSAALAHRGGRLTLPVGDRAGGMRRSEPIDVATLADVIWRIDFAGPPNSFASFPAGPLVRLARSGATPEADNPFRERFVLVGAAFEKTGDVYPTPVGLMRGVEIQANAVHTLLARRALLPPHWAVNVGLMALVCAWVALLSLRLRAAWVAALTAALVVVLVLVSYDAYSRGYWLDFVAPVAAMLLYHTGSGWVARRRLRRAFGEFVSPEIVARVDREDARLGSGEVREVSVLMSDVRGFTTFAEERPPADVPVTMNEYFAAMVAVVVRHHGMVQDFVGDGILAVYGAPADDPEHAWHAVQSAVEMQAGLRDLNARWAAEGRATLAMGVAVNTGRAFAGLMGAPQKKKYTVMGDVVNTASRIEAQNRELGTGILVSASTLNAVSARVVVKGRGVVHVKGKTRAVDLFEVLELSSR